MNEPDFRETIEAAAQAAKERAAAREAEDAAKEEVRLRAKAAVDAAMAGVVKPTIQKAREQLSAKAIPTENGWGADRYGNPILTLRILKRPYPPAIVFTAETGGAVPRLTVHEELEHSAKEPRRTDLEEPTREGVAAVIREFLMKAM